MHSQVLGVKMGINLSNKQVGVKPFLKPFLDLLAESIEYLQNQVSQNERFTNLVAIFKNTHYKFYT